MEPNRTEPSQNQYNQQPKSRAGLWTIIGVIIVAAIVALIYFATQKTLNDTVVDPSDNNPITNTPTSGTGTVLGASERVAVTPTIKGFDVVNLQTFPYKVQARITATLPDACSNLDVPLVAVSGKIFTVSATASREKDAVCAQTITSREIVTDLPVAGLAAGKYTVKLGTMTKTFTLAQDNEVQFTSDK